MNLRSDGTSTNGVLANSLWAAAIVLWFGLIAYGVFATGCDAGPALAQVLDGLPRYLNALTHVPRNLIALPQALLVLFSGLGIGDVICARLGLAFRTVQLKLAAGLCLGLICLTLCVMAVGLLQLLNASALGALIAAGVAFSVFRISQTRKHWLTSGATATTPANAWTRTVTILTWVLLVGTLYLALLGALEPEIQFDGRMFHLGDAKRYMEHGGLYNLGVAVGNPAFDYPQYQELVYTAAFGVFGMFAAKVMSWCNLLLAAIVIVGLGTEYFESSLVGLLAALLFAGTPIIAWSATTANTDLSQVPFFLLSLYAVLRWRERPNAYAWLVFAGLFAGYAFGTKPFSLMSDMVLACLLAAIAFCGVYFKQGWRGAALHALAALGCFAAAGLVVALPGLIRAGVDTGDPFFPIFARAFHSPLWGPTVDAGLRTYFTENGAHTSWSFYPLIPWMMTMHPEQYADVLGPTFLFVLPIVTIYAFRKAAHPLFRLLLGFIALWSLLWYSTGAIEPRYLTMLYPLLALMAAFLAVSPQAKFLTPFVQKALVVILFIATLSNAQPLLNFQKNVEAPHVMGYVVYVWDYLYGGMPEDDVQLRYVPMIQWMNGHLHPRTDRVWSGTADVVFNVYSNVDLYDGVSGWHWPRSLHSFDPVWSLESTDAYERLKALHLNYVLVSQSDVTALKSSLLFPHLREVKSTPPAPGPIPDGETLYRVE